MGSAQGCQIAGPPLSSRAGGEHHDHWNGVQHIAWSARLAQDTNALDFVSNLSNYIPLGCVSHEDISTTPEDLSCWQDLSPGLIPSLDSRVVKLVSGLLAHGWIRAQYTRSATDQHHVIFRIYFLPEDVGLRYIDRRNAKLATALEHLVAEVDVNPETWQGRYRPGQEKRFDIHATADECSLFYMFNQIPSPAPDPRVIQEKYSREALEDLLDPEMAIAGLKTMLYPYQRRSAALMLQRETVSKLELDPRLEHRRAPDGTRFFYNPRDVQLLRDPRFFEAPRGGILAETMGLGKTVICISLILATKNHPPKVPRDLATPVTQSKVSSLMDLAISAINRHSIPWKVELDRLRHANRNCLSSNCISKLEHAPPRYEIPNVPTRWNRATVLPPPQQITLASTTIIVVPRNLCRQWESEMEKHVERGAMRVLVMNDAKQPLPEPDILRTYDTILFSRPRFDQESKHGLDNLGRTVNTRACQCSYVGSTRRKDCHCVRDDSVYESPLKHLHFKRLIIDEGHFFGQSNSNTVLVANRLVRSDHRWVISGTPARDLLGVEMDMKASDTMLSATARAGVLEERRSFSDEDKKRKGAIDSLGLLASSFLKMMPWSGTEGEKSAIWKEHIYSGPHRAPVAFSICLRRTLESMVVKTRPEDVERDIALPPLHHKTVRLVPSFYDKLTANLFTLVLTANAVTSERTDADYLFHKNSQKARYQLVSNLRQSFFCWTGFSEADAEAVVKNSHGYLSKEGTGCTAADRELLIDTLRCTETALGSKGWTSLSRSHELGIFVDGWPDDSAEHWAFEDSGSPLLTGISQLLEAQSFVNARLHEAHPSEGLSGVGIRALAPTRVVAKDEQHEEHRNRAEKPIMGKLGVPASSLNGEPSLRSKAKTSPSKLSPKPRQAKSRKKSVSEGTPMQVSGVTPFPSHESLDHAHTPPADTRGRIANTRVVGTTSAKMSYLVSQIMQHYQSEKILVFYQGDNTAYYIAQVLELMHIRHEIYAKSLSADKQSEYVVRFNQEPQDRVLLMDVNQAALGLNLCSASRIYFVNPVCRPNIEAQAIKRAHRIGQTREVFVETLVLRDTIEERIFERSNRMTRSEHLDAKVLEDDGSIREIIQGARRIELDDSERTTRGQMAPLQQAQQLWGRPGRPDTIQAVPTDQKRKRPTSPEEAPASQVDRQPVRKKASVLVKRLNTPLLDISNQQARRGVGGSRGDDEPLAEQLTSPTVRLIPA